MSVVEELLEKISNLTLTEASELKKALEDKFGVTAAAPVMMAGAAAPAAAAAEEEKTEFTVFLAEVGADKIKDGKHIDVGLLGTKAILNALSENGYAELAYEVALQETYPSWGWWIKNGATTLYENWNIDSGSDISLNHIMFGEIGAWFYKGLGGIFPDPENPGFKNVILKPNFVPGLDQFEASHDGPFGKIESKWQRTGGNLVYTVAVPPNSTATLFLLTDSILEPEKVKKTDGAKIKKSSKLYSKILLEPGVYTFNIH